MFSDRTFSNERTVRPSCQVTTHRQQQKLLNDETKISDGLIEWDKTFDGVTVILQKTKDKTFVNL